MYLIGIMLEDGSPVGASNRTRMTQMQTVVMVRDHATLNVIDIFIGLLEIQLPPC